MIPAPILTRSVLAAKKPIRVGGGMLAVGEHLEDLRDLGRGVLALYIGGMGAKGKNFYNDLAVRYGYEELPS